MMVIDSQENAVETTKDVSNDAVRDAQVATNITVKPEDMDPDTFYYYLQDGRPKVNVGRTLNKDVLIQSIVDVYKNLPTDVAKGEFLALVCTAHRLPTSIINSNSVDECAALAADAAEKMLAPGELATVVEISPEAGTISAENIDSSGDVVESSGFDGDDANVDTGEVAESLSQ